MEVTQIDANKDILQRLEELEKTNLEKDAQIKYLMDRMKNLDVKVIEHNDVQEKVDESQNPLEINHPDDIECFKCNFCEFETHLLIYTNL